MGYNQADAKLIRQVWAPHISPPAGHPLAVGTLAKELVQATLTKPFPTAKLARAGATALTDAITHLISTQTFVDHTVKDLDEEAEIEVPITSPFLFPSLTGLCGITNGPTTSTAPPSGLAPADRTSPFRYIPLGHNEKGSQTQATDSQIDLDVSGGVIHSASKCTHLFNSLSRDSRESLGPTQPYIAPSVLEDRTF